MFPTASGFRVIRRPKNVISSHDFVVVDSQGIPHPALTFFGHSLQGEVSASTLRTYLSVLSPYFGFLEQIEWLDRYSQRWNTPTSTTRDCLRSYLRKQLLCKVQKRGTYERIFSTRETEKLGQSTVSNFLAALKRFYQAMIDKGEYDHAHPLLDGSRMVVREVARDLHRQYGIRPQMPQRSGVEFPQPYRVTENYFYLVHEAWVPKPIDDPDLPRMLLTGMKREHICLRDQLVVRIAYESGARISEILGLTVGDWRIYGYRNETKAFSKGSEGRRIKTLHFSQETAKLLHRYANQDRKEIDPQNRRLVALLDDDPLFLTARRTPYTYKAFQPRWKQLCAAMGLHLNIHGLRHWYVTQSIRFIVETSQTDGESDRRKAGLVKYMAWKSVDTLQAYEHYFQRQTHIQEMATLHQRWEANLQEGVASSFSAPPSLRSRITETAGWDDLLSFGESDYDSI